MFRIALFLAMNFVSAQLNLAPCTEDSHCSVGSYCEEGALYCRPCLRCQDHQREAPQEDFCVKSLVQCGDCLKGLVTESPNGKDKLSAGCVLFTDETKHHPYLPPYAWAAIAIGLVLMLVTAFVFLKTKMLKVVSYSSSTSVHSLRGTEGAEVVAAAPPPPYNYHLPSTFPPGPTASEMAEIRKLVDSPELCPKPSEPQPSRPREAAGSQAARVFNNPAYVRIPQTDTRCSSPEVTAPEAEATVVPVANNSLGLVQPTRSHVKIGDDTSDAPRYASQNSAKESRRRNKTFACAEVQDSNNNYQPESSASGPKIVGDNTIGARIFGGTSFVINLVENISTLQQQNQANCYHTNPV